ncbi:MAG: NosD domain-containing protein [Candidatus Bathyarchaeia archaeon]
MAQFWRRFWRRERAGVLALGIICVILGVGLVGAFAYHVSAMNDKSSTISLLNSQVADLQKQTLSADSTINSLNSQTAELENQFASINSIVAADNSSGTIYIRADGSVDPPTAPISTIDSVTYTFTDNVINDSIVVERNNIVIDGAGHTVLWAGMEYYSRSDGIDLAGRSNVTVKNLNVMKFQDGIRLSSSSYNTISGNKMTNNNDGIDLEGSSYNVISGNNMTSNTVGIYIEFSSGNIISGNNIASDDFFGMVLDSSSNNNIRGNTFFNDGLTVLDSYGNVVVDNVVNGKPLVYLEDVSDYSVGDAGQVVLVDCNRIKVENLTLSYTDIGLELWQTNNTSISGNTITNNKDMGIVFENSSYNSVSLNNITSNNLLGFEVDFSSNNTIYLNNFNNSYQVTCAGSTHAQPLPNVWDDGTSGNYWSDYTGTDANNDGRGDTPYVIDSDNIDRHPLMKIFDPIQGSIPGDLNNDGKVNLQDLAILANAYGSKPGDANWNPKADIDGNGVVDLTDLVILATHYGYQQS